MEMKANTVYARAQAAILWPSGHLGKDIAKLLKKTERWVNKWSKRKFFFSKTNQEVDDRLFWQIVRQM